MRILLSAGHPDLKNASEPTSAASRAKRNNKHKRKAVNENHSDEDDQESDDDKDTDMRTSRRSASTRKRIRLTTFEVTEIIVEKNVKSLVKLQALAHQQKKEGKTDLVEFLVKRTPRAVADILNTTWEIENAADKPARSKKTRLELLQEAKEKQCTEG